MVKKIFIIFLVLFFNNTLSYSDTKIVYIDLDLILLNSNVGKELFENLKNSENLKIKELQDQEKELKNEENKILGSKNLISDEQFNSDVENFKIKLSDYNNFKKIEIDKLKNKRNKEVTNLLNTLNSIIENYMAENSISMIIDKKNIYIAHKKHDITDKLIEIINKNIK